MRRKRLGEQLNEARRRAKMSFEDLANATKMPARYLRRLEKEEYEKLPRFFNIIGILKSWAQATGADFHSFRDALGNKKSLTEDLSFKKYKLSFLKFGFVFTFKHFVLIFVIVLALSILGYLYYSQSFANIAPKIEIENPADVSSVVSKDSILLSGDTNDIEFLYINDAPVELLQDGSFSRLYSLDEGLNAVSFLAKDKNGQTLEVIRSIVYSPQEE